jgi:multiple sugar transport system permease protein/putative aldouronate transport system permease protein
MKFSLAKQTAGDKIFYSFIFISLTLFLIIVLYPCIYVLSASFSSSTAVISGRVVLWPVDFSLVGYRTVFSTPAVWTGFRNSVFYTVFSIILALALNFTMAYCLSRKDVPGRNFVLLLFTITMFFSCGLIQNYLLNRGLGLINTPWIMIIHGSLGAWTVIICRTFISNNIPQELLDASMIDGCSDIHYYIRIVLPLSKAIIAVQALFIGVGNWNAYFGAMIYLSNRNLFPLTLYLREILIASQINPAAIVDEELQARVMETAATIKYALIVVTMVPVIVVYPFVQKHFVKGVLIGSIKG